MASLRSKVGTFGSLGASWFRFLDMLAPAPLKLFVVYSRSFAVESTVPVKKALVRTVLHSRRVAQFQR